VTKTLKVLIAVSGAIGLVCTLASLIMGLSFGHAPTSPEPSTGYIVPFASHGGIFYITALQDRLHNILMVSGMTGVFVACVCSLRSKRKPRSAV
jgi:hypothetical protein